MTENKSQSIIRISVKKRRVTTQKDIKALLLSVGIGVISGGMLLVAGMKKEVIFAGMLGGAAVAVSGIKRQQKGRYSKDEETPADRPHQIELNQSDSITSQNQEYIAVNEKDPNESREDAISNSSPREWASWMEERLCLIEELETTIDQLPRGQEREHLSARWQNEFDNIKSGLAVNPAEGMLVCGELLSKTPGNRAAITNLMLLLENTGDMEGLIKCVSEFKEYIGTDVLVYTLIRNGLHPEAVDLIKWATNAETLSENASKRLGEQYFALGHSYLQSGESEKIIMPMTKAIELGVSGEILQKAYANRAFGYFSANEFDKCIADIDTFFAMKDFEPLESLQGRLLSDRSFCKKQIGDIEGALADADKAVHLNKCSVYLNDLGNIQQEAGLLDEAITSFTDAIAMAPQDAFILTNRANAKVLKRDFAGALDDFTKAIENGDLTAFYNRGNLKLNGLKDYDGAIADFTNAINCDACTDKHYYYYNRAFAKHLKEDLAGALEDCDLAHRVYPNYIKPIRLKAKTHFQLGALRLAKEWYVKILDRHGEDFYDWNELGTIQNKLDNHESAVGCLRQSIRLNLGNEQSPSDSDVLTKSSYYLSHSFYRLGEYQDAVTVALECEQYCILNAEYLRVLACVYDEMGDSAMALETINRAITLDDSSAEIWYDRGVIRRDIGDLEGALEDFKKAIAINPSFTSAYHNIGSIAWYDLGNREMGCSYWKKAADLGDESSKDLYTKNCVTPGVSDAFPGISDL